MKRFLFIALPLVCGAAYAFSPTLTSQSADQEEHHEESPLHDGMEQLNRSFRTLRKSLKDEGRNEESLLVLVEAQRGTSMAKTEVPPAAGELPEAERAAFVSEYRIELIKLEQALLEIELALIGGDNAKAAELLKVAKKMEGPGHEKFTQGEE